MLRRVCLLAALISAMTMTIDLSAQDRSYGRSMVVTDRGIVATSHYLASQAGAQVLAKGGSAMDAAIAANATLGVTEPMMNGIGGGRQDGQALRTQRQRICPTQADD